MKRSFYLAIIILITCLTELLKPQSAEINAFDNVSIKINFISNRSTDALTRYWDTHKGFEGVVQMPFYLGDIQGGARYLSFKEKAPNFHDFSSYFFFLGWGKEFKLPLNCSVYAGLKFGGFHMSIHDDSLTSELSHETELAGGISSYLSIGLINSLSLTFGADYTKVYIYKKIELFLLSAGLSYTFQSPVWLKEILN
jgi:hypothetical protein